LDHTLVHATNDAVRARPQWKQRDDVRTVLLPASDCGVPTPTGPNAAQQQPQNLLHYIKLRPHVVEFLKCMNKLYEISVYTAGTRLYAEQITMILSRAMISAPMDHNDILQLQASRDQLNMLIAEKEKEKRNKKTDDSAKKESTTTNGVDDNKEAAEKNGDVDDNDDNDKKLPATSKEDETSGSPAQKKRRVRFSSEITDNHGESKSDYEIMTLEELQTKRTELQTKLKEVETMEKRALAVRQRIFGSRIVSRTDVGDLGPNVKSLKRVFPCGGKMAVIVDDREDVWANASNEKTTPPNVVLVRPYHFFIGARDVNNVSAVDLSGGGGNDTTATVRDDSGDEQLLWTKSILERVHERYYAASKKAASSSEEGADSSTLFEKTVPELLTQMRREVLHGSNLIFSGLIPLHHQQAKQIQQMEGTTTTSAATPTFPLERYAVTLGATVCSTMEPNLTHVVAERDGTEKVIQGRNIPGCFIVKKAWLMECLWSLTRRQESLHILGDGKNNAQQSQQSRRQPLAERTNSSGSSSSSDEEDDDDFIAELEMGMETGE